MIHRHTCHLPGQALGCRNDHRKVAINCINVSSAPADRSGRHARLRDRRSS